MCALTVRYHWLVSKNPIAVGDLGWIFARNCERSEQLLFLFLWALPDTEKSDLKSPQTVIVPENLDSPISGTKLTKKQAS